MRAARWKEAWTDVVRDRSTRFRLLSALVVAVVAIAIGFVFPSAAVAETLFRRFGYWFMFSAVLLFGWALWKTVERHALTSQPWRQRLGKETWWAIGTIALVLWVALVSEPWGFKVTNDEYVLQATALNLHLERQPAVLVRAYDVNGVFVPLFSYTDKRPFFFAFLLSLADDLTGYRTSNAFVLNAIFSAGTLILVYVLARRVTGNGIAGLCAVVLWGGVPLFAQNANGSGMEMLNLAMLGLVILLAWNYLVEPDDARISALVLATVLLAQTRYESALFVGVTAAVVLIGWRLARRVILPWPVILAPLLLLPYAWQNRLTAANKALWELQVGEETRFSVQYLGNNAAHAIRYFFSWHDRLIGNSWLLSAAATIAGAVMIARGIRRWRVPSVRWVLIAYGAGVVVNLGVLMFYYWGQLDDPVVQRLSLPMQFVVAIAVAWLIAKLAHRRIDPRWALGVAGVYLAAIIRPQTANHQYTSLNLAPAQIRWEKTVLEHRPAGERLIVSNKTVLPWIMDLQPAIIIDTARQRGEQLQFHLQAGTFSEILVMQRLQPSSTRGDFQVDPADALPPEFRLETVAEKRFGAALARISRLVAIRSASTAMN